MKLEMRMLGKILMITVIMVSVVKGKQLTDNLRSQTATTLNLRKRCLLMHEPCSLFIPCCEHMYCCRVSIIHVHTCRTTVDCQADIEKYHAVDDDQGLGGPFG